MTTQIIMNALSEKGLFAEFMRYGYFVTDPFTGEPTDIEMPLDVLSDPGAYGLTSGLSKEWSADLAASDYPGSDMDCMISDLQHFVGRLVQLRSVFAQLQARREVFDDAFDDSCYSPRNPAWPKEGRSVYALNNGGDGREGVQA